MQGREHDRPGVVSGTLAPDPGLRPWHALETQQFAHERLVLKVTLTIPDVDIDVQELSIVGAKCGACAVLPPAFRVLLLVRCSDSLRRLPRPARRSLSARRRFVPLSRISDTILRLRVCQQVFFYEARAAATPVAACS